MTETEKMTNPTRRVSKLPEMKNDSRICKELFPEQIHDAVITGELLFLIRSGRLSGGTKEQIRAAGTWWLWARNLFIENTMTTPMRKRMELVGLQATQLNQPIHFVSARSPELVHAQIATQADASLPRSRTAIQSLSEIIRESNDFLPTIGTILLADIAIDNLEAILKVCPDLERIIEENLVKLEDIISQEGLSSGIHVLRMSRLPHPSGTTLGKLINPDGSVNIPIDFSPRAERLIETASRESLESHKGMFGWNEVESKEHNHRLAETMALVGQAVKAMQPPALLIHNEAFIARGALNNLLTDPTDPLPVICLNTLLNKKKH